MRYVRVLEVTEPDGSEAGCRHCHNMGQYARRLCIRCWRSEEIRALYPATPMVGRSKSRGVGYENVSRPIAKEPTVHRPGSVGKFLVLIQRAELGVELWHPLDAKLDLR